MWPSLRRSPWVLRAAQAAGLVLAAVFVFSPAFRGGWLWDDALEVPQNAALRSARGLWEIWFAPAAPDYYPLKCTVQWLQWHLWGGQVLGYHLTSVALHVLSGFLLWRLLRRLGVSLAYLGAMIFVIHPLAVESVAWISELKNTLSLPPLLLAFGAWLTYDAGASRRHQVFALLWFAAAMLCKSSVVMFPCVLLLHAWWRRGRIARADLVATAPFFAVSLGLGLVTFWFQQTRALGDWPIAMGGFLARAAVAGRALVFYLGKCVWPVNPLAVYPKWTIEPLGPAQFLPWLGLGLGVAILWLNRRSWGRHALFGFGTFGLFLAPVIGFLPMAFFKHSWVADQFVYLPLVALVGLAAAGLSALSARLPHTLRPWAGVGWTAVGVLVALVASQSRRDAANFRSLTALWTYNLEHNPRAWVAHMDLGTVLKDEGRLPEAAAEYEQALRIEPDLGEVHNNLGNVLAAMGRVSDAIVQYREAVRVYPRYWEAEINLGNALMATGNAGEAVEHFARAVELQPKVPNGQFHLGTALEAVGRRQEAIVRFQEAVRLNPGFAEAHNQLGISLARAGRLSDAIEEFEAAIRVEPGLIGAHFDLGLALRSAGRLSEADEQFEVVRRLQAMAGAAHASP